MVKMLDLRDQFLKGELDKHTYSKLILAKHSVFSEYSAMLSASDIRHIEIDKNGVWVHSNLGPVCLELSLLDRGTPSMVALNFGQYERSEFDIWQRLVPSTASIADIGANIGWYSLHWATRSPNARIFSFEPVPSTFKAFHKNIVRNDLSNIRAEQLGMSDKIGAMELFVDPSIAGAASAHPSVYESTSIALTVQMTTLDNYASIHGLHFDAIKIDVEGGELAVLKGATKVLSRDRPILFVEMLRRHARAFGYHPNDILSFTRLFGYKCYCIEDNRLAEFTQMDDETTATNFFFIHASKLPDTLP